MALNKLSARKCSSITDPGLTRKGTPARERLLNDGGGLYLSVKRNLRTGVISKSWVFRWRDRVTGKLREKGLGKFGTQDVTLEKARILAGECRELVGEFKDPIEEGKKRRQELKKSRIQAEKAKARNVTFGWCANQYVRAHEAGWKNKKHAAQWISSLRTHSAPLMNMPVVEIETPDVLAVLKPIWETKNETASRVRGRIENVLGWATVSEYRAGDNPARWKFHLATVLPKPGNVQTVVHFAALEYARMGEFMAKLRKDDRLQARALEFLILTAARPGMVASTAESKGARWDEIGLEKKIWTLSAERMKAKKGLVIPLCTPAIHLLKSLPRVSGTDYVFPGRSLKTSISSASMLNLAKSLSASMQLETTAHGFRSSFKDWAGETTAHPREVIEMALAHQLKDKAEAAYARGNLLAKRRKLMKDWARHCDEIPAQSDNVVQIRVAKA